MLKCLRIWHIARVTFDETLSDSIGYSRARRYVKVYYRTQFTPTVRMKFHMRSHNHLNYKLLISYSAATYYCRGIAESKALCWTIASSIKRHDVISQNDTLEASGKRAATADTCVSCVRTNR